MTEQPCLKINLHINLLLSLQGQVIATVRINAPVNVNGNNVSECSFLKISWGSMPPDPSSSSRFKCSKGALQRQKCHVQCFYEHVRYFTKLLKSLHIMSTPSFTFSFFYMKLCLTSENDSRETCKSEPESVCPCGNQYVFPCVFIRDL